MTTICLHFQQVNLPDQERIIAQLDSVSEVEGFEQLEAEMKAYLKEENFHEETIKDAITSPYKVTIIQEQNWNALWESNFEPVIVNDFCGVRAHFHPPFHHVQYEIIITPKMSFGTGHHATTYQVIEAMSTIDFTGKKVCDFGTGTGVLAILAEKMGADTVIAIDNDDWSIENTLENLRVNDCQKVTVMIDDFLKGENFDIVLANINKNVLTAQMDRIFYSCNQNGIIILSGLLEEDKNDMETIIKAHQTKEIHYTSKNNWLCIVVKI
jgi:ribosomal protein L11 methyltransferase